MPSCNLWHSNSAGHILNFDTVREKWRAGTSFFQLYSSFAVIFFSEGVGAQNLDDLSAPLGTNPLDFRGAGWHIHCRLILLMNLRCLTSPYKKTRLEEAGGKAFPTRSSPPVSREDTSV